MFIAFCMSQQELEARKKKESYLKVLYPTIASFEDTKHESVDAFIGKFESDIIKLQSGILYVLGDESEFTGWTSSIPVNQQKQESLERAKQIVKMMIDKLDAFEQRVLVEDGVGSAGLPPRLQVLKTPLHNLDKQIDIKIRYYRFNRYGRPIPGHSNSGHTDASGHQGARQLPSPEDVMSSKRMSFCLSFT